MLIRYFLFIYVLSFLVLTYLKIRYKLKTYESFLSFIKIFVRNVSNSSNLKGLLTVLIDLFNFH